MVGRQVGGEAAQLEPVVVAQVVLGARGAQVLDVLHGVALFGVGGQGVGHGVRVRGGDGRQRREADGMADGGEPGDDAAPVVPDEVDAFEAEGVEQADDVVDEVADGVVLGAFGPSAG